GLELKIKGGVPQIEVGDASWQATALNQWFPLSFSITNPGDVDLTITNIAWDADTTDDEHFQMTSPMPTFPFVVAPSSQRTFDIAFNPHSIAGEEFRKEVVISSNATAGDSILVLQGSTLGVSSVDEEQQRAITIHPQPVRLSARGTLSISSTEEVLSVSISDQIGQVIGRFTINGAVSLPTSVFPSAGMYVLLLETTSGLVRTPVICID
ncbi:MAG: T9SS C-terminal target domain-containing protein, partial [Ignavibacteriae bacterium]